MVRVSRGFPLARKRTHVRKTIAFDGTAGNGATGGVTVFTLTGRVLVEALTIFCTETLEEAAPTATVALGTATGTGNIISATSATTIAANDWWIDATPGEVGYANLVQTLSSGPSQKDFALSESLLITVATQDVTNGTLVIDAWYRPITDNGSLV